jgi:hypothetical protein
MFELRVSERMIEVTVGVHDGQWDLRLAVQLAAGFDLCGQESHYGLRQRH